MSEKRTPMAVKRDLKAKMKELKPMIPRGTQQKIATELNLSTSYISDVVVGRRWDLDVVEALIKIGKKNLQRALKAESDIENLVSEKKKSDSK